MTYFVGIDVGGSKSAAALIDETGSTLARDWAEHADGYADALVDVMLSSAHRLLVKASLRPDEVAAFGVAVAGLVSSDRSTLVRAPTLGETRLDLGSRSAERLGRPVVVINDANATLYGHALHTAHGGAPLGGETHVSVLFTLGTGIGGSIMLGETIVVGEHGFASELGHVVVDFADQRLCLCGGKGCVEQFASGRGMAELAAASPPPPPSRTILLSLGAAEPYTARDIIAAAREGDRWARELLRYGGSMLGRAIATMCITLDPATVILAGSFGHAAAEWLLPAALEELRSRWSYAAERPLPQLRSDAIGPYAAATGAALFARAATVSGDRR